MEDYKPLLQLQMKYYRMCHPLINRTAETKDMLKFENESMLPLWKTP